MSLSDDRINFIRSMTAKHRGLTVSVFTVPDTFTYLAVQKPYKGLDNRCPAIRLAITPSGEAVEIELLNFGFAKVDKSDFGTDEPGFEESITRLIARLSEYQVPDVVTFCRMDSWEDCVMEKGQDGVYRERGLAINA